MILSRSIALDHPWVLEHLSNGQTVVDVAVQHLADQINASFREGKEGDTEGVVENLVNIVEWVLLVDDRVQQYTQGPDILFLATVGFALEDLGGSVVYTQRISMGQSNRIYNFHGKILPIVPTKTSKGPFLM